MKCQTGVDSGSGLVRSAEFTAANVHDVTMGSSNIQKDDKVVYGDSGYLNLPKREEVLPEDHLKTIDYRINRRPFSCTKALELSFDWDRFIEQRKLSVRCKVEHPYRIIKNIWLLENGLQRNLQKWMSFVFYACECQSLCLGKSRRSPFAVKRVKSAHFVPIEG